MRKMLQKLPTLDNSAQRSVFEICLTSKFNVVHMIAISVGPELSKNNPSAQVSTV